LVGAYGSEENGKKGLMRAKHLWAPEAPGRGAVDLRGRVPQNVEDAVGARLLIAGMMMAEAER